MENDGHQSVFHSEPHTSGVDTGRKRQPPKNLLDGMIKALRPKQWVKNSLVIAAPAAAGAGVLLDGRTLCLLYTSPSPRDVEESRMPSSA